MSKRSRPWASSAGDTSGGVEATAAAAKSPSATTPVGSGRAEAPSAQNVDGAYVLYLRCSVMLRPQPQTSSDKQRVGAMRLMSPLRALRSPRRCEAARLLLA